jgi:hypothetical protein
VAGHAEQFKNNDAQGGNERGEQMATLEGTRHGLLVSDRLGDLIDEGPVGVEATKISRASRWRKSPALFWLSIKHVSTVAFGKSASICA